MTVYRKQTSVNVNTEAFGKLGLFHQQMITSFHFGQD